VKTQRQVTACPRKKTFFDSLNEALQRTRPRLRFGMKSNGCGGAVAGDRRRQAVRL
jgi:hypothetical protein